MHALTLARRVEAWVQPEKSSASIPTRRDCSEVSARASHGGLQAALTRLRRYPLIVIDEVGYIPLEPDAAPTAAQATLNV